MPDGNVEFLGRMDHQVKVRGFRIELGEIEATLAEHPQVKEAITVASLTARQDTPGDQRLVAYVVPTDEFSVPASFVSGIRHYLKTKLPDYMVPAFFVTLDALPLTPNGKVNRRALPAPAQERPELGDAYVAPRTPSEEMLAGVWTQVLGLEQIGINDNFFELGGHSLLATQVMSRVRDAFHVDIPLRTLFEASTVAGLAKRVDEARQAEQGPAASPIAPVARDGELPLSFSQQRLWFLDQWEPGQPMYDIPMITQLKGPLDVAALERSLDEIVRRHEALRAVFTTVAGRPAQVIRPSLKITLPVVDFSALPESERRTQVRRLTIQETRWSFDLTRGPLMRATLACLEQACLGQGQKGEHVLFLNVHHIVSDGWSMGVLARELGVLYAAFCADEPSPLPELPVQYVDYAAWQREWLLGEALEAQLSYWKAQLGGELAVLELPTDRPRPPIQTYRGRHLTINLSAPQSRALKTLSQQQGCTLFMTLLAAFKTLLCRYTRQDDVIVGAPIAGRNQSELEGLVGFFLNSLALRTDLSGDPSFRELLGRVREVTLGAYAHQDVPFEKLLKELQPLRDPSRTPLFQVFFNMINLPGGEMALPGIKAASLFLPEVDSKFDLTLYVDGQGDEIQVDLVFNADLFTPERMAEMLDQYQHLLSQIVADPDQRIQGYSLVTPAAQANLPDPTLALGSHWEGAVHERFSQQARRAPERLAVVDQQERWTYAELEARSNQLAHCLRDNGVQAQGIVAIYGHRSVSLVWAVLGVLKAGAAFVILDPVYPVGRLVDCLRLAQPQGWLQVAAAGEPPPTLKEFVAGLACRCQLELPWWSVAAAQGLLGDYATDAPGVAVGADDLAYVAFTSGSMGAPKGILGRHGPLAYFLPWQQERFRLDPSDRYSMLSGLSHDPLQRDIFTSLALGATLCIPDPATIASPGWLAAWMRREGVSVAHLTPAMMQLLTQPAPGDGGALEQILSLRYAFIVGDVLTRRDVARLQELAPAVTCVNFYGSTETQRAVGYFVLPVDKGGVSREIVPAGRGMPDVQLLVLDGDGQLAGIGELGEIYVRSPHLARGYLGDERLTQERFIVNPFTKAPADRLYRTGDLGRYLPDGEVEFQGRIDQQVKIRGFRIELGEIEAVLGRHPAVEEAVVIARAMPRDVDDGWGGRRDKRLAAYVVLRETKDESRSLPSVNELRDHLKQSLPEYMIPSAFVTLASLPLTPNGKVDRRALPAPEDTRPELETGYVSPRSQVERAIAAIWQEVLQIERVGVHDNFFDLGGHSLLVVQIQSRLQTLYPHVSIVDMFQHPTVSALARYLYPDPDVKTAPALPQSRRRPIDRDADVAIIGLAGRFPGAANVTEFWQNIRDGVESITFFSDEELLEAGIPLAQLQDPDYVKAAAILEDYDLFDAQFFGFTPYEARITDPQHRLFLECAWEALEGSGYAVEHYGGQVGVFAGSSMSVYLINNLYTRPDLMASMDGLQLIVSTDKDHVPTKVSYKLNLKGPSVSVQTACSTSLVAVHLACQSLLNGECDIALAGGASVGASQKSGYSYIEGGIFSPDGHCRAFDAQAKGTVFGGGVAAVTLKRLANALADGDPIHAVIKGSAINNDGGLRVGYTAPGVEGQASVIRQAHVNAGVAPDSIQYVEAHGTGTALGDPIEVTALTQAFQKGTDRKGFCALGSLKTNVGHLIAAAGVGGLIKTVLALKHQTLPPSLHFEQPNPQINFDDSPFYVNTQASPWQARATPRRAGVSAFGIGGTNAHVVLEQAPVSAPSGVSRPYQLLLVSAKTQTALDAASHNLRLKLAQADDVNLADVAYTLQVGRRRFAHRRMLVCATLDEAVEALETPGSQRVSTAFSEMTERPVIFMFPGQGAQYVDMARDLYETESVFRAQVDACAEILKPHLGLDLRDVLYPAQAESKKASEQLGQTALTQPALFTIEYALAKLWMAWGLQPHAMIGHSIGEYVAACLAGVFSLEDALALVAARGRLMQSLPGGAMLAVSLSAQKVRALLKGQLDLATVNGPAMCVISGPTEEIESFYEQLTAQEVTCRRLHTSHAFHSAMMTPVLDRFRDEVARVPLSSPQRPFVSNVTGTWIAAAEATDPDYWTQHLRQTVRFSEGLSKLLQISDAVLLEVGPGRTLGTFALGHPESSTERTVLSSLRHPRDRQSDVAFLLNSVGKLWLAGVKLDWSGFYAAERRRRLTLPTYPFERLRYWIEPGQGEYTGAHQDALPKKPDMADWFYIPGWERAVPPNLLERQSSEEQTRCWLLFSDTCGLGSQILARLKEQGHTVVQVMAGEQFEQIDGNCYALRPSHKQDFYTLFEALQAAGRAPQRIVHLWNVTPDDTSRPGLEAVDKALDLSFYSLLYLAQALAEGNTTPSVQIDVISNHLHQVTGQEPLCPEKALLLGPCKVITREFSNINCRSIDISLSESDLLRKAGLVDWLMAEFTADPFDVIVAYRGGHRWTPTYQAVRLDDASPHTSPLREQGVYLITGGLGGIGLTLAAHLAKTVQAKLILLGRSALPERNDWPGWLANHDDQDDVRRKIQKVMALEKLGAEVMVASADVANQAQMHDVITKASERFGEIHGVIHSAGIAGGGMIELKTPEMAARVLGPKVLGTRVLEKTLQDVDLDFFVLCSSLTSILSAPGQIDYCAANAFLDSFAHHLSSNGTFTLAVNWGAWQEVGMAVNADVPDVIRQRQKQDLQKGITPDEGIKIFDRLLSSAQPQIVVSTQDLDARLSYHNALTLADVLEKERVSSPTDVSRSEISATYVEPRNEIEWTISSIWQELLGIKLVGIHDKFFELGGHSLLGTQLVNRLRKHFGLKLPLQAIFDAPTVAGLAQAIMEKQVKQAQAETGEADILSMLEGLSDQEVAAMLENLS